MSKSKTISREQVLVKFNSVKSRMEQIENIEPHGYKTVAKYLPGIGAIHELKTPNEAVKALKYIKENSVSFDESAAELDLEAEDLEESTIQGFSEKVWIKDIKARVAELKLEAEYARLKLAKKVLKKHLSEDDIFEMEMSKIGGTLDKLPEDEFADLDFETETESEN